jgi:hypothetical protein
MAVVAAEDWKALEAEMRSAVIVLLFLFSMLFLGAQAAQLEPSNSVQKADPQPTQHADAAMLQPVAFDGIAK